MYVNVLQFELQVTLQPKELPGTYLLAICNCKDRAKWLHIGNDMDQVYMENFSNARTRKPIWYIFLLLLWH